MAGSSRGFRPGSDAHRELTQLEARNLARLGFDPHLVPKGLLAWRLDEMRWAADLGDWDRVEDECHKLVRLIKAHRR